MTPCVCVSTIRFKAPYRASETSGGPRGVLTTPEHPEALESPLRVPSAHSVIPELPYGGRYRSRREYATVSQHPRQRSRDHHEEHSEEQRTCALSHREHAATSSRLAGSTISSRPTKHFSSSKCSSLISARISSARMTVVSLSISNSTTSTDAGSSV